jgi:hypothetical protein
MDDSMITETDECLAVFKKYGYTEQEIINMIISILGAKTGSTLELKGLSSKAYLTPGLDIVYNGGKRHGQLERAIKLFASM